MPGCASERLVGRSTEGALALSFLFVHVVIVFSLLWCVISCCFGFPLCLLLLFWLMLFGGGGVVAAEVARLFWWPGVLFVLFFVLLLLLLLVLLVVVVMFFLFLLLFLLVVVVVVVVVLVLGVVVFACVWGIAFEPIGHGCLRSMQSAHVHYGRFLLHWLLEYSAWIYLVLLVAHPTQLCCFSALFLFIAHRFDLLAAYATDLS